GCGCSSHPED
nr:Chain E, GLY-CYS-GLY-CYS-SER-SER [Homo sapiens]6H6A_H Chain H, GLY-CYS-GLY-CYS-SER-SER [Homo sapiens]6H6A_K Chain K, GLY-CYS-GLY-CYS-SER-SER [Homo sapiens]7OK6_BBB Chain BBB, LCK peptide [Homo sapiens]7OK6_CCC Chain CCC, LCK peptide [Homo sapiens]